MSNIPKQLIERGFAGRSGFGSKPALVVVDYSKAFTSLDHQLGSDASSEIAQVNELVLKFRSTGHKIFFMTICYDSQEEAENSNWRSKIAGVATLYPGVPDIEIDDRLSRTPDDPVIRKKYASSFFGTDLHQQLQDNGADTVVITGTSTSGCVRATAVDACQLGYKAVVCSDAVSDRDPQAHAQALIDIEIKYGDVMSRSEIDAILDGIASQAS